MTMFGRERESNNVKKFEIPKLSAIVTNRKIDELGLQLYPAWYAKG